MNKIEIVEEIKKEVSENWRNLVKVDNPSDNPLCDAYNDGVDAMANHVVAMLNHRLCSLAQETFFAKGGEE